MADVRNNERYAYRHAVEHVLIDKEVKVIQAFARDAGVSHDAAIRSMTRLGIAVLADTSTGSRERWRLLVSGIRRAVAKFGETAL